MDAAHVLRKCLSFIFVLAAFLAVVSNDANKTLRERDPIDVRYITLSRVIDAIPSFSPSNQLTRIAHTIIV